MQSPNQHNGPPSGRQGSLPSHPPSEPRPLASRPGADAGAEQAPGRFQVVVVLVLLLVLVAIPLYLWRRPTAVASDLGAAAASASSLAGSTAVDIDGSLAGAQPNAAADAGPPLPSGIALSEVVVQECHDPGSKRTAPKDCDHLPAFEKLFAQAIVDNATCASVATSGGTIAYEADVSFARKKQPVMLSLPHEGRTLKSSRAVTACAAAVKKSLASVALTDASHQHSRYKLEIVATYGK